MNSVLIRPARADDSDLVADLITRAFANQPSTNPPPSAMRVTGESIREHFTKGGGALLAQSAEQPEAAVLWQPEDKAWRLSRLSVLTHSRRRGLALALLNAVKAEAADRHVAELRLATRLCLLGNRALFAQAGFQETSLHCHPGFGYPTYVEMIQKLGQPSSPGLPIYETPHEIYRFAPEGVAFPGIATLLARIAAHSASLYPPEGVHMLPAERLMDENVWFIAARGAQGIPLGCGAVVLDGATGEIKRMFVDEAARGQGLANAILALLEHHAFTHGVRLMQLETGPQQPAAIALYERSGYKICGPFGNYTPSPYSVFMEKSLL
jgi:putative acetyltransferase